MDSTPPVMTEEFARGYLADLDELQHFAGLSQPQIERRDIARAVLAYWQARRAERIAEALGA